MAPIGATYGMPIDTFEKPWYFSPDPQRFWYCKPLKPGRPWAGYALRKAPEIQAGKKWCAQLFRSAGQATIVSLEGDRSLIMSALHREAILQLT